MNLSSLFQQGLLIACLFGASVCLAAILIHRYRALIVTFYERWLSLGRLGQCVTLMMLTVFVLYGSTKAPSTTNEPPDSVSGEGSSTNDPPSAPMMTMLLAPKMAQSSQPNDLRTIESWQCRGAWNDWIRISFDEGFDFPVGTNLLTEITVLSQGSLRDCLANSVPFAALPEPVSLEPDASSVCYGLTASNSFVIAWTNACVLREATNRINAAIELFASGNFSIRYGNTTTNIAVTPPPGYIGEGQNGEWATNTFPFAAAAIVEKGYENWLMEDYVGINEQNGLYKATITLNALPETGPCYLVCGPYKVIVTEPGSYSFPLEVFETYTARTYPRAVALSISIDDGYRSGSSVLMSPLLPNATSSSPTNIPPEYVIHETPRLVLTPDRIPLNEAVGTHISIWCNITNAVRRFWSTAMTEFRLCFCNPSDAEILDAEIAMTVEIILENEKGMCSGSVEITDPHHHCCSECCGDGCWCDGTCCECRCGCIFE